MTLTDPRTARLVTLIRIALHPPAGTARIALALGLGALCHILFAAGVLAMIVAMFFGLSESFGNVPWPWAVLANAALILQFPLAHSLLLTGLGGRVLARLIPGPHGQTGHHHLCHYCLGPASSTVCAMDAVGHRLVAGGRGGVLGGYGRLRHKLADPAESQL